jgi:hypothetical protein
MSFNEYIKGNGTSYGYQNCNDKKLTPKLNILYNFFADHSGRAVEDMNYLCPLKHWDRGFHST